MKGQPQGRPLHCLQYSKKTLKMSHHLLTINPKQQQGMIFVLKGST
jgi:hypothetical protein